MVLWCNFKINVKSRCQALKMDKSVHLSYCLASFCIKRQRNNQLNKEVDLFMIEWVVMKLAFFIDVWMIGLISFYLMKKKRNQLENIFIIMMVEFVFSCYYAILYINLDVWTIGKSAELFIIFRLYEVLVTPLLFLFYFNLLPIVKKNLTKMGLTVLFMGILLGVECWLVAWNVIIYTNWQAWKSLLGFVFTTVLLSILLKGYQFWGEKPR